MEWRPDLGKAPQRTPRLRNWEPLKPRVNRESEANKARKAAVPLGKLEKFRPWIRYQVLAMEMMATQIDRKSILENGEPKEAYLKPRNLHQLFIGATAYQGFQQERVDAMVSARTQLNQKIKDLESQLAAVSLRGLEVLSLDSTPSTSINNADKADAAPSVFSITYGLDEARYELAKIEKAITLEAATWYYIEECIKELIASGVLDERERTQWKQAISWSRTRNFLIKERRDSKQARKDAQTYLQEEFEAELDARLQMGGARKAVKLFEEQFVERMRNPRDNGGGLLVKELFYELLDEAMKG